MNDDKIKEENTRPTEERKGPPASGKSVSEDLSGDPEWVAELDSYPLRDKSEDPRWAVRTVWIWVGFALLSIAFILTLLILGAIYD